MMTLGGAYSINEIRQYCVDKGWIDANGYVVESRWREIHAEAKARNITSFELDAAFGLAPGTVAKFLSDNGAQSLDAPQASLPQPEAVQPVRVTPMYTTNIRPETTTPLPTQQILLPSSQPISLPPYDYTPPPLDIPIPSVLINESTGGINGGGVNSNSLMWVAISLGVIGLLKK